MMNFYHGGGQLVGPHLQIFFCSLLFLAAVFLVIWAIRFAKKEELKKWMIGLLIVGLLGSFVSFLLGGFGQWGMGSFQNYGYGPMTNNQMWDCAQDEDCHEDMEDSMNEMMDTEEGR